MKLKKYVDMYGKKNNIAYYKVKGGKDMTNTCGNGCGSSCCNTYVHPCSNSGGNSMPSFAFILVLFILLVICGTAYIF